jgi:hypothetical protein
VRDASAATSLAFIESYCLEDDTRVTAAAATAAADIILPPPLPPPLSLQ